MTKKESVFNHKHPFTLGVEEEFMLCEPHSGNLVNKADAIMTALPSDLKDRFSYELILSEIEVNTPICKNVKEAINEVVNLRNITKKLGEEIGFRIGISGTHPDALAKDQKFVNTTNYEWVKKQLGYYARRNITFALHIHVAVPNAQTAIQVTNGLRRWIPALLSLSANSPFFEGNVTGMKSSRTMQFGAFPRTNIPQTLDSFSDYETLIDTFKKLDTIEQPRQIWWKIRPHFDFGTIEFRMIDIQRSLKNTEMFIALAQALTYRSMQDANAGNLKEDLSLNLLNDGLWKAMRFGMDKLVIDTGTGEIVTLKNLINRMCDYSLSALKHFNSEHILNQVNTILENGTEGDIQLSLYNSSGLSATKQYLMDSVDYGNN